MVFFLRKLKFIKLPKTHMHTDINIHTIQRNRIDLSSIVMQFDGCSYMQESSSSIVLCLGNAFPVHICYPLVGEKAIVHV